MTKGADAADLKAAIGQVQFVQKVMSKDIAELVVHTKEQNGRIGSLETSSVRSAAVLDTLKWLLPIGLTFAGILSGVIFGILQLVAS